MSYYIPSVVSPRYSAYDLGYSSLALSTPLYSGVYPSVYSSSLYPSTLGYSSLAGSYYGGLYGAPSRYYY